MKKISTMFAAMFAATSLFAAADIYEIRPCDAYGNSMESEWDVDTNPIKAGQPIYFNVRLISREQNNDVSVTQEDRSYYDVKYLGTGPWETYDKAFNALKIGIVVSGQTKWASLIKWGKTPNSTGGASYNVTDLVFEYNPDPGDLALPIRLAQDENGTPVSEDDGGRSCIMQNGNKWGVYYYTQTSHDAVEASFSWCPSTSYMPKKDWLGDLADKELATTKYTQNYSLKECGFWVRTLDIENRLNTDKWESEDYWKTVAKNHYQTGSIRTEGDVSVTNLTTLWVWAVDKEWLDSVKTTSDEEWVTPSVEMAGDNVQKISITYNYNRGTSKPIPVEVKAAKVDLIKGQYKANFTLKGIEAEKDAYLVLSGNKDFLWNSKVGFEFVKDSFVVVPVRCVKAEREVTLRRSESAETYTVTSDYETPLTTFDLTLAEDYAGDVTVKIQPELVTPGDPVQYAWTDYIRISAEPDGYESEDALTMTFTGGTADTKTVYVFGRGAASENSELYTDIKKGNRIKFVLTVDPSAAAGDPPKIVADSIYVKPADPVIANAAALSSVSARGGVALPIDINVSDNYTDINDKATGYKVMFRAPGATEEEVVELKTKAGAAALWRPKGVNGTLYAYDKATGKYTEDRPAIPSNVETGDAELWLVAPNAAKSERVSMTLTVTEPAQVKWAAYATEDGTTSTTQFKEYDSENNDESVAYIGVTLSEAYTKADMIWAFLKLADDTKAQYVTGDCIVNDEYTSGIPIQRDNLVGDGRGIITFKDGLKGGTALNFTVVLCTSESYDEDNLVTDYKSNNVTLKVGNVAPTVNNISMSGWNLEGTEFEGDATKGINQYFTFDIKDAALDLEATGDDAFKITCQFKGCSPKTSKSVTYKGNPADLIVTNKFSSTGVCTLSVTVEDKDGGKTGPLSYTFDVVDNPYITIANKDEVKSFYEDETPEFWVTLSNNPSDEDDLEVELTVAPQVTGDKKGALTVDGDFTLKAGTADTYLCTYSPGVTEHSFTVKSADGTAGNVSKFTFKAKVTTKDKYVPETDTPWSDYFTAGVLSSVQVKNAKPSVTVDGRVCRATRTDAGESDDIIYLNSSNAPISVAIGEADKISWSVDDVTADLDKGITVTIVDQYGPSNITCKTTATQTFTPQFKYAGTTTVTLTATDKDGGSITVTRFYLVKSTRQLNITAVGPSENGNSSTHASYYRGAGRGQGHVYADAKCTGASNFSLDFNCGLANFVKASAQGYRKGNIDDGSLTKNGSLGDVSITPEGKLWTAGAAYFAYDGDYDSFFYCWLKDTYDNGVMTSAIFGAPSPEVSKAANISIDLPTEKDDEDSYAQTTFEVVFSKEYLTTDNVGDINNDGIPDIYALGYEGFGVSGEEMTDMKNLREYNDDGDYFPFVFDNVQSSFIFMPSNNWVSNTRKFTAYREIRGWGDHFNDAYQVLAAQGYAGEIPAFTATRVYTDPGVDENSTLTREEYDAWVQAGKPDDWSPERPTDPTKADTDGDEMPDGYEYYIWYKAHVGWFDNNDKHQYLTGHKYNHLDPTASTFLTPEAIASAFDPLTNSGSDWDTRDMDNDGLTDYQEYLLGTSPWEWDTDNDLLPDGYEVFVTGTDPRVYDTNDPTLQRHADGTGENPDGDAMALFNMPVGLIGVLDGNEVKYYCLDKGTFEPDVVATHVRVGTVFTVRSGDNTYDYVTSDPVETYEVDGKKYLKHYITKNLWPVTLGERIVIDAGANVLMTLERGMEVTELLENQEYYYKEVFHLDQVKFEPTSAKTVYAAWKYRTDGVYALGKVAGYDFMDKPVVFLNNTATVRVMHDDVLNIRTAEAARRRTPLPSGYNPTTAWQSGGADSAEYVNHDEFMSMFYLYHKGVWSAADITPSTANPFTRIWTRCPTSAVSADTEGDQIPDGWELYVGEGKSAITHENGSNANVDADGDWLTLYEEYSGIDSSAYYGWSPKYPAWRNKKWPTDPNNADTDDDGLTDAQEGGLVPSDDSTHYYLSNIVGTYFKYNGDDDRPNVRGLRICWAGGMLNPCWCDTDLDGLPDEWEAEFHGSYIANETGTINTNVGGTNTQSIVVGHKAQWNMDGMDGTVDDARLDYDGDGLANWQEYFVGAMRCWRYDDAVSPWESGYATVTNMPIYSESTSNDDPWNKFWHDVLLDSSAENRLYNPHMANGICDPGRYFTRCPYNWVDGGYSPYGKWYYFKDGANHELADFPNPNYQRASEEFMAMGDGMPYSALGAPLKYISCDPRLIDSDHDGMDDYYELFHGMNPLLGAANVADATGADGMPSDYSTPCDLVFDAYVHRAGANSTETGGTSAYPACARNNFWTNTKYREAKIKNPELGGYDFVAHPWMNGLANADADGDGIVNIEEAIMPNVQAASTYHHTDPTPLWTTDSSYTNSLTRRFYRLGLASDQNEDGLEYTGSWTKTAGASTFVWDGVTYDLTDFDGFSYNAGVEGLDGTLTFRYDLDQWGTTDGWAFSFEENEGFDSDHDYLSDMEELQGKTKNVSDPQVHDDPLRRQAMYFNGEDAFLQTPVRVAEVMPTELFAPDQARQNFLYFTVECWAKADESILGEQATYTMVERAIYADNAGPADENLIRKNFQIAIKNGRWYACYDSTGTTAKKYEINNGPVATTDWTLVTATFDGEVFKLYVNGEDSSATSVRTQAQPEHGVSALAVTPYNAMTTNGYGTVTHDQDYVTILVGASVKTKRGFIFDNAWRGRNFSLITPENPYGINWDIATTFGDYQHFFKGYIDEVRIWDGARTPTDVKNDYDNRTRYSFDLAEENRLAVYTKWAQGCSRAPTSEEQLPALLMYHWAFDHIPGAVLTNDVVTVPAGFDTAKDVTDASAQWVRPDGFKSPHWDSVGVRSTVYGKTAWVPWLNNTVAHLPRLDRTTLDSVYWSDDYIGYSAVASDATMASYNVSSISFPRNAEVPSVWHQQTYSSTYYDSHRDPYFDWWNGFTTKIDFMVGETQNTRWHAIAGYETTYTVTDETSRFSFTSRDRNVVGDDLLPMGGVYPRRISVAEGGMWDNLAGQTPSASDAWAQTGEDANNNGLPDWWEEYARTNYGQALDPQEPIEWDTTVRYRNGEEMPAYQAYLRDLASGLVKVGNDIVRDESNYADMRDANQDKIPDWWEELFGLDTSGSSGDVGTDSDGDGLSDHAEYLISEVYKLAVLDPRNAKTDGSCIDYFRKYGDLYFGEMVTDHDQVNDIWEQQYAHHVGASSDLYANRDIYDPSTDRDGDGWSNYAEAKAGTSPENITSPGIDGEILKEYPVPAIRAKVVYRGKSVLSAPLVFQAWSEKTDPGMTSTPDAAWRTASDAISTNVTKYIGINPGTTRSYYLGPGKVSPGSVRIDFRDMAYERATVFNGKEVAGKTVTGEVGNSKWFYFVQDRNGDLYTSVTNLAATVPVKVGTIDYTTGCMTVDFGCEALQGVAYDFSINGDTSTTSEAKDTAVYSNCDKLNLSRSYVKIGWLPVKTDTTGNATYYLSDCTADVVSKGRVCEGKNKFVVFSDTDDDKAYTPGEPFGFVGGVDVGWQGGAFEVELTETSPIFARVDLTSGSDPETDREAFQSGSSAIIDVEDAEKLFKADTKLQIYGESTGYDSEETGSSESRFVRVRVVRALVDGSDVLGQDLAGNNIYVDRAVVMDKYLDLSVRGYIHEGDFLSENSFDIGWSDLQENVYNRTVYKNGRKAPVFIDATNITYMIVMGEGSVAAGGSNTVFRSLVSRRYDSVAARQDGFVKPVIDTKQPGYAYGAKPTFRWAMQDKNEVSYNSYSAFKLQIRSGSTVVYDSGYRCAPARGADGWYEWALSDPLGSVVAPGSNYTWRVAMFNAKFGNDTFWNNKYSERAVYNGGNSYTMTTWSESGALVVDINRQQEMNDHGYSTIAAAVKYAGPSCVLEDGKVILQAFETADFAGDPMGEAFVTDVDDIADTAHVVANARVIGLPANGTYYLRAFIDSNGNGVRDDWESWGAADQSVTIAMADVICPTVSIYIEDADTDGDWIPDAYEYAKKGNLEALGPEVIEGNTIRFIGTIATSISMASASTGLTGASLTIFQNQVPVKMAMANLGLSTSSIDDIREAVEKKVDPETVKITALTLAPDGSKVTLTLSAEVTDSVAGELLGKVYDLTGITGQTATVTVNIYKKNTLAEEGWTLVGTQTKTFGWDEQQVDVGLDNPLDMASGFYKVEVVQ